MAERMDDALRRSALFRRLTPDDRQRLTAVAAIREYAKGSMLFQEGDASESLYTVVDRPCKGLQVDAARHRRHPRDLRSRRPGRRGRRLRVATLSCQRDCARTDRVPADPSRAFFALLETHPTMVRGLLVGLTHRLVELTNRLAELSGGRVEGRLARFSSKLAHDMGQRRTDGTFIRWCCRARSSRT
jgi:CRP-like cAMP-binding protein